MMTSTTIALFLAAATSAATPTPMGTTADVASLYSVKNLLVARMHAQLAEYNSGLARVKALVTGDHSRHRRLAALDTWANDLLALLEAFQTGEVISFQDALGRFQGISCSGGALKLVIRDAILSEVSGAIPIDELDLTSPITSIFGCLCSPSWDLDNAAMTVLFNAFTPLVEASFEDVEASTLTPLVAAFKGAIPSLMGSNGMCSSDCTSTLVSLLNFAIVDLADNLAGVGLPTSAAVAFPSSVSSCICGGSIAYDKLLDDLAPQGAELSTIESVVTIFTGSFTSADGVTLLTNIGGFVDFVLSAELLCGGTCAAAVEQGTTLAIYAGTRAVWPDLINEIIPNASTSDLPQESEIAGFAASEVACICSTATTEVKALVPTITPYFESGIPSPSDNTSAFIEFERTLITAILGPTNAGGGFCGEPQCPAMLGHALRMVSGIVVRIVETDFHEGPLLSAGALTKATLDGVFAEGFDCLCHIFNAQTADAAFEAVQTTLAQWEQMGPSDLLSAIFALVQHVLRAADPCTSTDCRLLFDNAFSLVDRLLATTDARSTGILASNGASACTADAAAECFTGACWSLDDGQSQSAMCSKCYPATLHSDFGGDIEAYLYWGACSASQECPGQGIASFQITSSFTIAETAESFDASKQTMFREAYVALLGLGAGVLSQQDVMLTITTGSLNVEASVLLASLPLKNQVVASIDALDATTASSQLGVMVTSLSKATATTVAAAPPPPAPGMAADSDDVDLRIVVGVAAGVGVVGVIVIGLISVWLCRRKLGSKQDGEQDGKGGKKANATNKPITPRTPLRSSYVVHVGSQPEPATTEAMAVTPVSSPVKVHSSEV